MKALCNKPTFKFRKNHQQDSNLPPHDPHSGHGNTAREAKVWANAPLFEDYCATLLLQVITLIYYSSCSQDQDSLLVKRRNDNHSPGPVIRELVPSSHQRSELSNTILCIFSGWDQRIGEGIPIPDSLGEEATFINICIGNGSLKCHRVLIPTTPSFGDKVICWYTGFTFKTFI